MEKIYDMLDPVLDRRYSFEQSLLATVLIDCHAVDAHADHLELQEVIEDEIGILPDALEGRERVKIVGPLAASIPKQVPSWASNDSI